MANISRVLGWLKEVISDLTSTLPFLLVLYKVLHTADVISDLISTLPFLLVLYKVLHTADILRSSDFTCYFSRFWGEYILVMGHPVAQLFEALYYKPEGLGFDSRCH